MNTKSNITSILYIFVFIIFLTFAFFYLINSFSYFDPINLCYIKLKGDSLRGNEKTISDALKQIKKQDKKVYQMICKNVDIISEKFCVVRDAHIDRSAFLTGNDFPGCYVRGSRVIYLHPQQAQSQKIIDDRAKDIQYYAGLSKNFWEKKNK